MFAGPVLKNNTVEVVNAGPLGRGLVAARDIAAGEVVADWTGGTVYHAAMASQLPPVVIDHAIQFGENEWIDTDSPGRFLNHSCEPNCGARGKFQIVAMRAIRKGEPLTFDYEMTEDSDWRMQCLCGSPACRGIIGAFAGMPEYVRRKYDGFISDWLLDKYALPSLSLPAEPNRLDAVPAVCLPDARGWYKMVTLAEIEGRFFLREGASHSEALRRLLGEFSALGVEMADSRSLRGEWQEGSWQSGSPVLRLRASDGQRGEGEIWKQFFKEHPLEYPVNIEFSLREARDY